MKILNKSWKKLWPAVCPTEETTSEDLSQTSGESCVADDDLLQMFGRISGCSDVDIKDVSG